MNYYEDKVTPTKNAFADWTLKENLDKQHYKRIREMVSMIFYVQKHPLFSDLLHKKMKKKIIMSLDDYDIRELFVHYFKKYIEQYLIEHHPEKVFYDLSTKSINSKYIYLVDFKYNLDYIKEKVNKEINMNNLINEEVNDRIEYLIGEVEYCNVKKDIRKRAISTKLKNETPTDRLIAALGGNLIVAKMLNVSSEAVSRWKTHGIPADRLDMIELRIMKNQL